MNDQELNKKTMELSDAFFGLSFTGEARFNYRLRTTGGRYIPSEGVIEINPKYLEELGYEELDGIIKHELCHYHLHQQGKPFNHRSREFRELLKATGSPRFCKRLPSEDTKFNYIYFCKECNKQYSRKRRINLNKYRCGKCRGELLMKE
ncbi:SprT family protein [Halalkalibacillus sediminis]|uniref:SprT family protein n=1 Tax=Halalkalibacillus sediminis TaxID=2018042 RepID=A0A2I0QRQ7_9BACI|nr:SprT family protein [Halalkalibacillus sediminis]PKR76999.1 SprT family protein [Halalkalibacillus sediminis]